MKRRTNLLRRPGAARTGRRPMRALKKLSGLFLLIPAMLCALPAQADIPSPGRDRRNAEVRDWHRRFPNLEPTLELALAPDGKTLLLELTFRSPGEYTILLDGKERGHGKVAELGGAVRTERVPLFDPPPSREDAWRLKVEYTLRGVEETRFGPKLTNTSIQGCAIRNFGVSREGDQPRLGDRGLDGGDYFELRQCGL